MSKKVFIGLGGTGCKVLSYMKETYKDCYSNGDYFALIDLDRGELEKAAKSGIKTICISTSGSVADLANETNDRLTFTWLPNGEKERSFLEDNSAAKGAGQRRLLARLCLAAFLAKSPNEFTDFMASLRVADESVTSEPISIVIISSIAGGTGAGTFLQFALYIRKYMLDCGARASIELYAACPGIFENSVREAVRSETPVYSINANAFAIARELNAMTVAASAEKSSEYVKGVSISMDTMTEGALFPTYSGKKDEQDLRRKPFDNIYLFDNGNKNGNTYMGISEYFRLMGDCLYSRFFTPLYRSIDSDLCNIRSIQGLRPLAIYGSTGYSKILYPGNDVAKYMYMKKFCDDLDDVWTIIDLLWYESVAEKSREAAAKNGNYSPSDEDQREFYIQTFENYLNDSKDNNPFMPMRSMIYSAMEDDYNTLSSDDLDMKIDRKIEEELKRFSDDLREKTGFFDPIEAKNYKKDDITLLQKDLKSFAYALMTHALDNYLVISSEVISSSASLLEESMKKRKEPGSLFILSSLLSYKGKGGLCAVHPVAARYLLYLFDKKLDEQLKNAEIIDSRSEYMKRIENVSALSEETIDQMSVKEKDWGEESGKKREDSLELYISIRKTRCDDIYTYVLNVMKNKVKTKIKECVSELCKQYNFFFSRIKDYSNELEKKIERLSLRHESDDNRIEYIGASQATKENIYCKYIKEGRANIVLSEAHDASGFGIFKVASTAMGKAISGSKDDISDKDFYKKGIQKAFDGILDEYGKAFLNNQIIQDKVVNNDIFSALVEECEAMGFDVMKDGMISSDFAKIAGEHFASMVNKGNPMIKYENNIERKDIDYREIVSSPIYICINSEVGKTMEETLRQKSDKEATPDDLISRFFKDIDLTGCRPVLNDGFKKSEITLYTSVENLEIDRIIKFQEKSDDSTCYYYYYKRRIEEMMRFGSFSLSPHLDKRWHSRGYTPFISRELERLQRVNAAKAFLYAACEHKIYGVKREEGAPIIVERDGRTMAYTYLPMLDHKILVSEMAKSLYHVDNNDELIVALCNECEAIIQNDINNKINDESDEVFFNDVAKCGLIKALRESAFVIAGKDNEGKAIIAEQYGVIGLAWLVKSSEEKNTDKDYAEKILEAAKSIIENYLKMKFPKDNNYTDYKDNENYKSMYNNLIDAFMKAFAKDVKQMLVKEKGQKQESMEKIFTDSSLSSVISSIGQSFDDIDGIDDEVRASEQFRWACKNWKHI